MTDNPHSEDRRSGDQTEYRFALKKSATDLLRWYYADFRSYLLERAPEQVAAIDNDAERLHRLLQRPDDITVCFLGHSGIGKSTLLNSVAANEDQVLPSGGIGPLTAQATEVHYSEVRQFSVDYHKRSHLWRIGFALEREVARAAGMVDAREPSADMPLDDAPQALDADEFETDDPAAPIVNTLKKQAAKLVTGNQYAERPLPYLVDAIRLACGYAVRWNAEIEPDDFARVERIGAALDRAEANTSYERRASENAETFANDLHDHAAGFLAPLINTITVGWPSEVLQAGVRLVDLPGVGIANDAYRRVTRNYIREKARAVILVVDRAARLPTRSSCSERAGIGTGLSARRMIQKPTRVCC